MLPMRPAGWKPAAKDGLTAFRLGVHARGLGCPKISLANHYNFVMIRGTYE